MTTPVLIKVGSEGLEVLEGLKTIDVVSKLGDKSIRCANVSPDGKLIAYFKGDLLKIAKFPTFEVVFEKPNVQANVLQFSPNGNILAIWHLFVQGTVNNLHIYDVRLGELLKSFAEKKQSRWCPVWSKDEKLCVRHVSMELLFYENNNFERYVKKLTAQKVNAFSLITHYANGKHYLACYTVGAKGQPSFVRIYQYPNVDAALVNKSFYKADHVDFKWNPRGDALLLVCATDVDQSGKSYYGEQALHYLDIKGETFIVKLNKDGPIHNTAWVPSIKESFFCVIYGFMPAKAALFNTKAEIVFEFGEPAHRNHISFCPFGNLVALAGFGNLRGEVQIWNLKNKAKVCDFKAQDTTQIQWCPDGLHVLTATTSPRLKVGNGFRIWTYEGTKIYENIFSSNLELYEIYWKPCLGYEEPILKKTEAKKTIQKVTEPQKYIPPHLRQNQPSKSNASVPKANSAASNLTEAEKKIKNLKKKLDQIEKLKEQRNAGKILEKNQLEKISKEEELLEELHQLRIE